MSSAPEISGYELGQRLLEHPLAEIWRGRSFTGMEVVVLVLSEAGADDPTVRERLGRASRIAALDPDREETPLWAANLTATRPYAVTQLVPGQSGAERLIDPLDGLIGNDEQSLAAVREQLSPYGVAPVPAGEPLPAPAGAPTQQGTAQQETTQQETAQQGTAQQGTAQQGTAQQGTAQQKTAQQKTAQQETAQQRPSASTSGRRTKRWVYLLAIVVVLAVFSITYSVGAAVRSATANPDPVVPPPAAVSPEAMPDGVLKPGIDKPIAGQRFRPGQFAGLVGAVYPDTAEVYAAGGLGLPFEFGFPRPRLVDERRSWESSTMIYRRVLTRPDFARAELDVRIAVRPCRELADCLAGRAAFDKEWTAVSKTTAPATPRGDRTWCGAGGTPYTVTMSHAFKAQGAWWLVGVAAMAAPDAEALAQQVVNDIWRQTP